MTRRRWSDITVKDVFCGAGGNTIGAKAAGLRVRVALNHWQRAIDTYGDNNPEVDVVERVDVSLCDPRRYPSTDIGIFSPECTTHSPAGGNKHRRPEWHPNLFPLKALDPATVRSRVTMLDVVRFTEYHRYNIVLVENVVEAVRWELFADWLQMMDRLGYDHRILCFNSMFFHPTPQSRDRTYIAFWRKGNLAPKLDYQPVAPCARCGVVEAVQVWKNGRTIGKYRRQYIYACPRCAKEVTPFYYAALNALDFSLEAERIGDRSRPLKPRTMDRIRFGLEKYGRRTLVVNVKQGERDSSRAWPAEIRELGSVPTWDNYFGVAQPGSFLVACANGGGDERRTVGLDETLRTVHAGGGNHALVNPGFLVETAHTHSNNDGTRELDGPTPTMGARQTSALVMPFVVTAGSRASVAAGDDPMPTQTATERLAVVSPFLIRLRGTADDQMKHASAGLSDPHATMSAGGIHDAVVQGAPFVVPIQGESKARSVADALPTQLAECAHDFIVQGAAQISLRDADAMRVAGLDRELMTQGCAPQAALIQRSPFLVQYYGTGSASAIDAPVPTVPTIDQHGVAQPGAELRVEDCYFRMLQPHEIGAAMAFPAEYIVGGNKRDRVKQYGNAVTPPVMDWIVRRCAATLAPELSEDVA